MMFALARDRAEAAARCARAVPPDRAGEQTHSLVSILMSFLALEAFINMVGGDRLGSRYRHYDRMSLEGKWLEVTRLVTKQGKTFDEDSQEMRALATLRSWRNMLTHYKGEYEEIQQANRGGETRIEALLSAENAARALEIARTLYRAFYAWDRRSPPRQFIWLDDRPHGLQTPTPPPHPEPARATPPPSPQAGRATPAAGTRAPHAGRRRRH
jgi:predicted dehydrogenase